MITPLVTVVCECVVVMIIVFIATHKPHGCDPWEDCDHTRHCCYLRRRGTFFTVSDCYCPPKKLPTAKVVRR